MYQIDFQHPIHIHFIGIGGISMSGLAEILLERGFCISGSDARASSLTEALAAKGASVFYGHRAENLTEDIGLIVYTSAVRPGNPELDAGTRLGIPTLTRAQLLGQIMKKYEIPIAVSGTHGKTTTTSMLSNCFIDAQKDPSIEVGAILNSIGGNYRVGNSEYFILESCEYKGNFLKFFPNTAIILNIDNDHLDYYKTFDNVVKAFNDFAQIVEPDGLVVVNGDDKNCFEIKDIVRSKFISYGIENENCNFLAENIKLDFYKNTNITRTVFHKQGIKKNENDTKIIAEQTWKLNVILKNNTMQLITDLPEIVINKQEIDFLIKGDIYSIVKKFIEPLYEQDLLQDYSFIKLTGQTSSIDLFREAMKEYMPGKMIQTSGGKKTAQHYKLSCVEGAIQYENAKKIGLIAPILTDEVPITPYQLTTFTYNDTEVIMMSSFEKITKTYGFVSKNIDTEKIDLILKNQDGVVLHTYQLTILPEELQQTTYEQTSEEYADKILQDDIDNILDDEMKLFTFSYGDKWGFCALPIARKDGQLLMGEKRYFPFESDEWEGSFFDGTK